MKQLLWAVLCAAAWGAPASYYTQRPDDPAAVYLEAKGDGAADDSDALQAAIDRVQQTRRQGIVYVPEGRYRITKTIYVWPSIRLIGYGAKRPVLLLAANTPGFTDRADERYMLFFAGGRPAGGRAPQDASPGTFYSAISNIDMEIGEGNHGASAVRGRYAQHCFLAHMEIRTGPGIAGYHDAGNVLEDVRFTGGDYGVWTRRPSPGWQLTMLDVTFEGQRKAAIREQDAGLTLIRPQFRNVPTAVEVDEGQPDMLYVKDARLENVTGPAFVISRENSARTQVNLENIVCRETPVFALFRESGRKLAGPAALYVVKTLFHGLHAAGMSAVAAHKQMFDAQPLRALPPAVASDLPDLPPGETWVNVRTLGAKGDGKTDDTAALRAAIAAQRALYLPVGVYLISDTLTLRPDTVLIGMHPSATQLLLADGTPAFQGVGPPKAMIETPKGGTNIVIGIGLYTNGVNPRAVAAKWMAGASSMMNDARFLGGHGTNRLDGSRENPYNNTHTADPELRRRWDGQYPSLWVTDGGGGTFFDLWTPSTFAQAGMMISDTTTAGRLYQMSSEHHVRHEVQIRNAANWELYALQTEAERGESPFAVQLDIENSRNILLANFLIYRVISSYQPFPYAVRVANSRDIRFRGFRMYSNSKVCYDAAVWDATRNVERRERELGWLDAPGAAFVSAPRRGKGVEKLAGGFNNISGGAAAPNGDLYFVDAKWQRIYRWAAQERRLEVVHDAPLDPVNLAFDKAGNLLVVSYAGNGTVYAVKPGAGLGDITMLKAEPAAPRPGLTAVLPVGDYRQDVPARPRPFHYLSPDGTTFIAADQAFVDGTLSWGIKGSPLLRSFGLAAVRAGQPFYLADEVEVRTYQATAGADGQIGEMKVFAEQGGEGVAVGLNGNVYLAAGHIHIYSPAGKLIETIETPERPVQLVFGGTDGRTLYVLARGALYAMSVAGR